MIFIQESTFEKAKQKIKENAGKEIIFSSNDDELNRKIIEKLDIDVLLIKLSGRKDFQKQRNSGFNQVLAQFAKKKNIAIGIDLDELIESKEKHEILARIKQNIKLCAKNKIQMKFIQGKHQRNIYDLKSLGLVLGMPTEMVKNLQTITSKQPCIF